MNQRIKLLTLITILAIVIAGCAPKPAAQETTKVVYLINGSLGDNAFYDSGQAGMDKLKSQYGVEIRTIECGFDSAQYEPSLEAATGYSDVIFVISYGYEDLVKEYADKYPDKVFVNLDTVVQNSKEHDHLGGLYRRGERIPGWGGRSDGDRGPEHQERQRSEADRGGGRRPGPGD